MGRICGKCFLIWNGKKVGVMNCESGVMMKNMSLHSCLHRCNEKSVKENN